MHRISFHVFPITVMLIVLGLSSLSHAQTTPLSLEPDVILPYKTTAQTKLSLHGFRPENWKASDRRPAIVFFFGGGWKGGTPSQFYKQSRYLSQRGVVAFCAEYRVSSRHKTTPRECVEDGKSAIRWVRKHAKELGIDSEKIVASGGSAGGHVAAAAALCDQITPAGEDETISCHPQALVLFNPVFDNGPNGGYGHDQVQTYWQSISPVHNIKAGAPPTIVFLGTNDKLIPVSAAKRYQKEMQKVGARCELQLYTKQGHGFFNHGTNFVKTLGATDSFLKSLGYVEGEQTVAEFVKRIPSKKSNKKPDAEPGDKNKPKGQGTTSGGGN